jgi:alcohol dehydrogenase class IV
MQLVRSHKRSIRAPCLAVHFSPDFSENLYRPLIPPPIKALCYTALTELFEYLPKCKANPNDVAVRQKLQLASWESLWPIRLENYRCHSILMSTGSHSDLFGSALGPSHALGHKLGAAYGIPHGEDVSMRVQLSIFLSYE